MVYSTDASKWRAYQYLDPFASGSFFVCNKLTSKFCRPDCDAHPTTELHLEIKFVDSAEEALEKGFTPCSSCNPLLVPAVDVNLLLLTVREINAMVGFVPPLIDEDEKKVTEKIKENIMGHGEVQRRMLVPANTYSTKNTNNSNAKAAAASYAVSKNDSEHYRLIDLACRHLALAAAISIFSTCDSGASSPKSDGLLLLLLLLKKRNGKKRRGGVLGFKELATKLKLSAWHFHRVFKSIIGLTPKTYGDMCWEFLEKEKEAMDAGEGGLLGQEQESSRKAVSLQSNTRSQIQSQTQSGVSTRSSTPAIKEENQQQEQQLQQLQQQEPYLQDAYLTPPQVQIASSSPGLGHKRRASAEELMPSPKRVSYTSPQLGSFNNLKLEDDVAFNGSGLSARAASMPNFNTFSTAPNSLFQHLRNFDFFVNRDDMPSTEAVFADHYELPSAEFSGQISPATVEDISPLKCDLAIVSPEFIPNAESGYPLGVSHANQGFTLAVDLIKEEELFPSMDMFPDLFKTRNEYPTDYSLNDPLVTGLAPELLSNFDY